MATRRFFIDPETIKIGNHQILGSDARHMYRVLRLDVGDEVELFDGTGVGYRAQIVSAAANRMQLAILDSFQHTSESPVQITLAQGFLKDRKMDDLIRPLTELGIFRLIPFFVSRSVPKPDERSINKRIDRWEKIAREAVKQCKRGRIPLIEPAVSLREVLRISEKMTLNILFYEEEGKGFEPPNMASRKPESILVVVGPEGGFSSEEIDQARGHGFVTAGLGPRILRSQTAAVVACTLVQYLYGDMGNQ
jgi:16S rRNA (uracil1498-N3)-methyltransferase